MISSAMSLPAPTGSGNGRDSRVFRDHTARFAEFYAAFDSPKRVARVLSRTVSTVCRWMDCEIPTAGARFAGDVERLEMAGHDTAPMRAYVDKVAMEARSTREGS